jgi:Pentapeptide repeats (9 copies)
VKGGAAGSVLVMVVAAVSFGTSAAPARAASRGGVMTAAHVRELLTRAPVALTNTQVNGTLDLSALGSVRWPFVCRGCTFYGGVKATGVVFERTFDLSGTIVRGDVDFRQASFRGPALFGTPPALPTHNTLFSGDADFRLARFEELVTFERATFTRGADFTLARFGTDAIFAETDFKGPALFERSLFSTADFRQGKFRAGGDFERTRFAGRAEFGQSLSVQTADFREARFAADASFRGAIFVGGGTSLYSATFEGTSSGGSLNFSFATLASQATFARMTAAASISFADATLPSEPVLVMSEMAARELFIAVPDVLHSVQPSDQQPVLGLLETTAQRRGDLGVANDALYSKRVLISRHYPLPKRALDLVFYRGIAGYLVRPFRPLAALVLLAALMTLIRLVLVRRPSSWTGHVRDIWPGVRRYVHGYLDTLALVGRSKTASGGWRLEVLAYRILLVCALVGLANSNPTLRQMIDALH